MKNVIVYFTGTGNSFMIAKELSEKLEDCEVLHVTDEKLKQPIDAETVGIVSPVYYWGLANIIKNFLNEVTFSGTSYIYGIVNYGTSPGASLKQMRNSLSEKQQSLSAGYNIKMPENYTVFFKVKNSKHHKKQFEKMEEKIERIAESVKKRERKKPEICKYVVDGLFGNKVNRNWNRKISDLDRNFVLNEKCNGCGICRKVCGVNNIVMKDGKPEWQHHCEFCMGCIHFCPSNAVNYKNITTFRGQYQNPKYKPFVLK